MRMLRLVVVLLVACGGSSSNHADDPIALTGKGEVEQLLEGMYWAHLDFRPEAAIRLGYHRYDGKVPDLSPEAISKEIERLDTAEQWLASLEDRYLEAAVRLDVAVMQAEVKKELFELRELRRPFRDPLYYLLFRFSLSPYIDRDYAPLDDRAAALLDACKGAPAYYRQMMSNLEDPLPRAKIGASLFFLDGTVALIGQVKSQMAGAEKSQQVVTCLDQMVAVLRDTQKQLNGRMAHATDDFALGAETFVAMLEQTQGIRTDLAALRRIGEADLLRNLNAIVAAAKEIDPNRPASEVIAEAAADKPEPDKLLSAATEQVAAMRQFVLDKHIASIPGDDVAVVRASPPHMRSNMASLDSAGPFEDKALPSYYNISPPDPSWPEKEQRAYIPSRADLLFLSIHEVWPGHFLQGRHIKANGSRVLQSFETYSTSEGWAHYTEEMMWNAGVGKGDPRIHIGQLKNALLRNVRFMVAIGLHTGKMTTDEAIAMFQQKAFADPGTARQQTMRGTGDPMYLSYTLGKLAIMKLHDDWKAAQGDKYSLQKFHDAFLRYGEAPLPYIRRAMLGADAGPVL